MCFDCMDCFAFKYRLPCVTCRWKKYPAMANKFVGNSNHNCMISKFRHEILKWFLYSSLGKDYIPVISDISHLKLTQFDHTDCLIPEYKCYVMHFLKVSFMYDILYAREKNCKIGCCDILVALRALWMGLESHTTISWNVQLSNLIFFRHRFVGANWDLSKN